jgi:hypothetical protein
MESVVAYFRNCSSIFLKGLRKVKSHEKNMIGQAVSVPRYKPGSPEYGDGVLMSTQAN